MHHKTYDGFLQLVEKEYSLLAEIMPSAACVHETNFIGPQIILK
jgi:hypothetical protein